MEITIFAFKSAYKTILKVLISLL